jgi:hypothetical protein
MRFLRSHPAAIVLGLIVVLLLTWSLVGFAEEVLLRVD